MIYTEQEIEERVSRVKGTHIKRNNLRKKLKQESNDYIRESIAEVKGKIRDLKAIGAREQTLCHWYAEITKLELQIL